MIEPDSRTPYVVVPKTEYDRLRIGSASEADVAHALRVAWMRRMRLDDEEIAESLRDDPPVNVQAEMKQIKVLDSLDKPCLYSFAVESYMRRSRFPIPRGKTQRMADRSL